MGYICINSDRTYTVWLRTIDINGFYINSTACLPCRENSYIKIKVLDLKACIHRSAYTTFLP